MPTLPVEGYTTNRVDGVTQIRPQYALPVEQPIVPEVQPTFISAGVDDFLKNASEKIKQFAQYDQQLTKDSLFVIRNLLSNPDPEFKKTAKDVWESLTGTNNRERYQSWIEKMAIDGATGPGKIMKGEIPLFDEDGRISMDAVKVGLDVAGLAGTGGLASVGVKGPALGSTPMLRPALKYGDKLYKGKPGQQHLDVLPRELQGEFQRQAMSGEDISNFNFGFVNHKGQFLQREDALKYAIDNGLLDPNDAKFGTLTSTMMNDNRAGTGVGALAKSEKPFYSALERAVEGLSQSKASGDQWLATLANRAGVKPDELEWSGLAGALKGKESVTKAELQGLLKEGNLTVNDIWKGGPNATKEKAFELAKEHGWKSWDEIDAATQAKYMARASRESGEPPTKYHSYQLPGGENYRELLMTTPVKIRPQDEAGALMFLRGELNADPFTKGFDTIPKIVAEAQRRGFTGGAERYKSSHWTEPNILAHMRMNDRTIDGKRSLHLEEVQSDWHQAGRKQGYKENIQDAKGIAPDELKIVQGEHDWTATTPDGRTAKVGKGVEKEEIGARDYLARYLNKQAAEKASEARIANADRVPQAPFKKNWHELALKRAIREAAENGYERLSWTPGEAQAARYDLSKQLKELQYLKGDDGKYEIAGITAKGDGFNHPERVTAEKLPDIVGKEMAEKIIKNEGKRARGHPTNGGYFDGVDLKVGGEGMKGFYDQILPKTVEKLGKEFGVKVQKGDLSNVKIREYKTNSGETRFEVKDKDGQVDVFNTRAAAEKAAGDIEKQPIFYIDIPPAMREKVMREGFPLFSTGVPITASEQ